MSSAQAEDIEKAASDSKTCEKDTVCEGQGKRWEDAKSYEDDHNQVPERTISDHQQTIYNAQQAYDDLHLHPHPSITTSPTPPEPSSLGSLGNLTTYLTGRMYIPTHLFLFVILILFIESAALFAYTTIGLLKSFPGPVPFGSFPGEGRCHCSPQNVFGEPGPAVQPFVVNVAPNIAVGAGAPLTPFDNAGPRIPIPVSIPTAMTIPGMSAAPSDSPPESSRLPNPASTPQRQSTTSSPSATVRSDSAKPTGTLPGLLPNLISDLVAQHSSTSITTTQSASRSAVTELVLSTTTLPPSVSKAASVVTMTTVVAPSSSSAA